MTEEQLCALLRLKRYEQPPPGYFDDLLRDVQRRQRAELLRRPLWRIGFERVQTFFSAHSIGSVSYAGAMAAALILGVVTIGLLTPTSPQPNVRSTQVAAAPPPHSPLISLQAQPADAAGTLDPEPFPAASPERGASRFPRYIIDARPASYEPTFQF